MSYFDDEDKPEKEKVEIEHGYKNTITVSQLNNYVKQVFEAEEFLHSIDVVGDIEGLSRRGNQIFFSLKDENAVIACSCWNADKIKNIENGKKVVAKGTVKYWNKQGRISFEVYWVKEFGFGELFLKFKQLQEKLRAEGFFDAGIKRKLPDGIKRIGVVTSKSGAVLHDIISIATRRDPNIDIVLADVKVQGQDADTEIARGIEALNNTDVDVIIVARGGGSREDLDAFNCETVARAVFMSHKPIVSAVGHQTDWTLVDFVADLRTPTPSAAAELCVKEILSRKELVFQLWAFAKSVVMANLSANIRTFLIEWQNLKDLVSGKINTVENKIAILTERNEANNPLAVLRKGFAKTNKQFDELKPDDEFEIMFYNGKGEAKWIKRLS